MWSPDNGAVAQLGERGVRNAEVGSSILLRSTYSVPPAVRAAAGLGALDMATETTAGDPSTDLMLRVRDGDATAFE